MKIFFMRHLKTKGNFDKRYIGSTDEPLHNADKQHIELNMPVETVFSSPLKRCVETAALLRPDVEPIIIDDLKEISFGDFENKTYEQLKNNTDYLSFIASNGKGHIPNGENIDIFKSRCCKAFELIIKIMGEKRQASAVVVCHGGTIMAIMEHYEQSGKSFYEYMVKNGRGFETKYNDISKKLIITKDLV